MKAVKKTKKPSVQQALNMTTNLRDKLGKYSSINLEVNAHLSGNDKIEFWCYMEDIGGTRLNSWSEVLRWYKENMND